MRTLLLSNHYEGMPLEILRRAVGDSFALEVLDETSRDELRERMRTADYLLVSGRMHIDSDVLEGARRLRMVQRTGVGLDNMDLAYLRQRGIPLYVNRGVNAASVAEHAVYLMLAALRRGYYVNRRMREGVWQKQQTGLTTHELNGKTVGIVGMGNIGTRVCRMLSAFDVSIVYHSVPRLSREEELRLGAAFLELDELLAMSDIVSLHCPADPSGTALMTRERIQKMRPGAVLVNTARGSLVDMDALVDALEEGALSAAGIDVYDMEPLPADSRILGCDDAVLSPHIAGVTYEAFTRMMEGAVANIRAFDQGNLAAIEDRRVV